jgi:hypothetical protein
MTRGTGRIVVAAMAIVVVCGLATPALARTNPGKAPARAWLNGRGHYMHRGSHGEADVNVCSDSNAVGVARCDAHIRTDLFDDDVQPARTVPNAPGTPVSHDALGNKGAYDPAFLQSAYNAPSSTKGAGQTVAVVDAFDAPTVAADLAAYRAHFGLPLCTVANGCFTKVNQTGGLTYPVANASWAEETALDVQMVSALCPNCHILLVEANGAYMSDLGAAVNTAVALGADVVSNSYGSNEYSYEAQSDHYFDHPGVAVVASTGDDGYGVSYPAASPHVVAVGGTSLHQATSNGARSATETVWAGAGSGCSAYEPKPAWQTDAGCPRRTVADVSAVADPSTGVWVYNSADGGWEVFGGTSAAAPIVGALYALAGNPSSNVYMSSVPYFAPSALNDVASGTNGTCIPTYLCTGVAGYDGPTGLGTPNSIGAFTLDGSTAFPAPAPDFSVTAAALHASMRAGGTAKSTVTVTPKGGLTGNVALSVAVSPSRGLGMSLSPATVAIGPNAASSKLTFAAHKGGKYRVTVTAKQGALVRKTTLTVMVNDFSMKVLRAKTAVVRGKRVRYTLKLAPQGAFNAAVKLSIAGLPTRDTVMYVHRRAGPRSSQTITITTSTKDARGKRSVRFTGISGVLRHSVTVVLTVQ